MSNLLFLCNLLSLCQIRSIGNDSHPYGLCGLALHGVCSPVIHEGRLTDREISSVLFWSRVFPVSLPRFLSVAFFKPFNSHFFISGPWSPSSENHTAQFPCPPLCTSALTATFSSLQPDVRNHTALSPSTSKHVGEELVSWAAKMSQNIVYKFY